MMKMYGKTIPELAEQIKKYLVEVVDKPSDEYKWIWGTEGSDKLPIVIDVQRNVHAGLSALQIKIGLITVAHGLVHYAVDGKRHKNYLYELGLINKMIDDNIWTAINIVVFADSGLTGAITQLLTDSNVECAESDIYNIRIKYHRDEESQRLFVTDLDDKSIYALEEAAVESAGGFLLSSDDIRDKIFKLALTIIKLPTFDFEGSIHNAHSEEAS